MRGERSWEAAPPLRKNSPTICGDTSGAPDFGAPRSHASSVHGGSVNAIQSPPPTPGRARAFSSWGTRRSNVAVASARGRRRMRSVDCVVLEMNVAQQAWEEATIPRLPRLLDRHVPKPARTICGRLEWYYSWRQAPHPVVRVALAVRWSMPNRLLAKRGQTGRSPHLLDRRLRWWILSERRYWRR